MLRERLLYLVDTDAAAGQRAGVELHAHRELLRAHVLHLRYAVDHGNALGDKGGGVLIDRGERQRGGVDREIKDGLVGWIDLLIRWRARHSRRQVLGGGGDGRLHVLGGGIERPFQAELQSDRGSALVARRVHRVQTRDSRELPLERRGYRRRHSFGTGAGQRGI